MVVYIITQHYLNDGSYTIYSVYSQKAKADAKKEVDRLNDLCEDENIDYQLDSYEVVK
jgi:hypothetical protein